MTALSHAVALIRNESPALAQQFETWRSQRPRVIGLVYDRLKEQGRSDAREIHQALKFATKRIARAS